MAVSATLFKCTQIFDGHGAGWSESYFNYATSIVSARLNFGNLMFERDDFLGLGYLGPYGRITQYVNRRNTQFFKFELFGNSGFPGDTPWQAVLSRLVAANGMTRALLTRGWSDISFTDGVFTPEPTAAAALLRFYTKLKSGSWGIVGQDPSKPIKPYATIGATGLVTFAAPHGYADGVPLYLYRAKRVGGRAITGRFTVLNSPSATTLVLAAWPEGVLSEQGSVREYSIVDSFIVDAFTERAALRKVGRPFGLYRGRARRRGSSLNSALGG